MNDDIVISIIVPIYNTEKYLNECVDSIINQTYKNIEIILVNDGSTDNCLKICDEYAKKDKRVKVIHKENGGLSSARNSGLDILTGKYVCFIDSDDYVATTFVYDMFNLITKYNADIVEGSYQTINDAERFVNETDLKANAFLGNFAVLPREFPYAMSS